MNKKTYRNFIFMTARGKFKQFLTVLVVTVLSVMLIVGLVANTKTLENTVSTYFETTNLADIWLEVSDVSQEDEVFFEENGISFKTRLAFEAEVTISNTGVSTLAKIYVGDGRKISIPYIEAGNKGVLIDKNFATNNDVRANSNSIAFSYEIQIDGQTFSLELENNITGTMSFCESSASDENFVIFIDEETFLELLNNALAKLGVEKTNVTEISYNQVLIDTQDVETTKKLILHYYETNSSSALLKISDRLDNENFVALNAEIQNSKLILYVFAPIFACIAMLCLSLTINDLVRRERRKIGTQKSIGIPEKNIVLGYCFFGGIYSFFGSVAGAILGTVVVPFVTFQKFNEVFTLPYDFQWIVIPWVSIFAIIFIATILGVLVALFSSLALVKKTPIECLKFSPLASSKRLKTSHKNFKNIPLVFKLSARSMKSNLPKTILAVLGIGVSFASLLCAFGLGDSISNLAETLGVTQTATYSMYALILKTFAGLLLCAVVFDFGFLIFNEKTKEIAQMKALGQNSLRIWVSVMLEVLGVCMVGIILGFALGLVLLLIFEGVCFSSAVIVLSAKTILVPIALSLFFALLISLLCLLKVQNIKLSDNLKNVE